MKTTLRGRPPAQPARSWQLCLYVIGQTARSKSAYESLREACGKHLKQPYRITVIDLAIHPRLARGNQILATPTVVRRLPKPVRILIGDLSETDRLLVGLDFRSIA